MRGGANLPLVGSSATGRGIRADHARIARAASAGVPYAVSAEGRLSLMLDLRSLGQNV